MPGPESFNFNYKEANMEFGFQQPGHHTRGLKGYESKDALEWDLAMTYHWSGKFWRDYFFFVANWHPLIGMFASHPAHPWTKAERVGTFLFSCSLTLLPPAMMKFYQAQPLTVFFWITLPVMICETAMYYIAVADIFCVGRGRICNCIAPFFKLFARCCLGCSLAASTFLFGMVYLLAEALQMPVRDMMHPFWMSRIQSWFVWFPLWFLLPVIGFAHGWRVENRQKERDALQRPSRFSAASDRQGGQVVMPATYVGDPSLVPMLPQAPAGAAADLKVGLLSV